MQTLPEVCAANTGVAAFVATAETVVVVVVFVAAAAVAAVETVVVVVVVFVAAAAVAAAANAEWGQTAVTVGAGKSGKCWENLGCPPIDC